MVLMNAFLYTSETTTSLEDIDELVDFLNGGNVLSTETSNNKKE